MILTERTGAYATTAREAYARWHADGAWSAWRLVAEAVQDVSIAADTSRETASALITVVVWVRAPSGVITQRTTRLTSSAYFRLTASAVTPAGL